MAQAPKIETKDDGDKPEEMRVTYMPGWQDPTTTKWRGITFRAGEAVHVKDEEHVKAAQGNRYFRVHRKGEKPVELADELREPVDPNMYRAHVVRWMQTTDTVEDLIVHWASERGMREKCGVGEEDIRYLGNVVEPKLRQMRMQEGLTEKQVAEIWMRNGIFDLPWRAA